MEDMSDSQKHARVLEIDRLLADEPKMAPSIMSRLLHEALDLCTDLSLDLRWQQFKTALEKLQREQFKKKKARRSKT